MKNQNPLNEYTFGNCTVYVKEQLPNSVDLQKCLKFVNSNLPKVFLSNVDMIYIGNFPFLISREVDALYERRRYLSIFKDNQRARFNM